MRRSESSHPFVLLVLALLTGLVISSCSTIKLQQPIPNEFAREAQRLQWTGSNTTENEISPPLEEAWRYNAAAGFGRDAAVVIGGTVLVANRRGEIHQISTDRGKKTGTISFGSAIESSPAIQEDQIFVASVLGRRTVMSFDLLKGIKRWSIDTESVYAGLIRISNLVIAADSEGRIRSFEAATGDSVWTYSCGNEGSGYLSTPVTDGNSIFAVDEKGCLASLDVATGTVHWTVEIGLAAEEPLTLFDDRLFVPTTRGTLIAIDSRSGKELWRYVMHDETTRLASPAVRNDQLVFGASDRTVTSLDPDSGTRQWLFEGGGVFAASPLLTPSLVYIGGMDRILYVLDANTGEVIWHKELRGRIKSAPVLANSTLIVLSEPRFVYGFREADRSAMIEGTVK